MSLSRLVSALLGASAVLVALCPTAALAGGFGLFTTGGAHGDRTYGYNEDDAGEWEQTVANPLGANFGGGLEIVLGDKDNKVLGVFRGYYLQDAPQTEVADTTVSVVRTTPRNMAAITAGLHFGVLGEPDALQMVIVTNVGAGIATGDLTEFVTTEAGVGATWTLARKVQLHASATGGFRYRKRFYPTTNAILGARYLFD
jgi:hypothetical protein